MEKAIDELAKKCKGKQIIGFAESNHGSVSSHKVQFELFKKLKMTNFSSEILSPLEVIAIEAWLKGALKISLKKLLKIMRSCGLGGIHYIKYAREHKVKFVATDYFRIYNTGGGLLDLLSGPVLSPEFVENIGTKNGVFELKNKIIKEARITGKDPDCIKNKNDKRLYLALLETNEKQDRYSFWFNKIDEFCASGKKLL